jgi:putative endonuclease
MTASLAVFDKRLREGEYRSGPGTVKTYYVYILSSHRRVLYTGVTGDLHRRMHEHRHHVLEGFTKRYNVTQLVYFESTTEVWAAIAREKQIKRWSRSKKVALVKSMNPNWKDLAPEVLGL